MKFTLIGVVIFVALLAAFIAYFGWMPNHLPYSARRAWTISILLFVVGAATACFGDKEYGMFPPTSLRWLFIIAGCVAMLASGLWIHAQQQAWALPMTDDAE